MVLRTLQPAVHVPQYRFRFAIKTDKYPQLIFISPHRVGDQPLQLQLALVKYAHISEST